MSRCEHGEAIKQFCYNSLCNWRQSAGCEICFKKHHLHPDTSDTITLQKLQQLTRVLYVQGDAKPKSKILQQAVYNYFAIMKTQISASLDAVSRVLVDRLGYPYLNREGQLVTFRRVKNKEYRKIGKKELKSYCAFLSAVKKEDVEQSERRVYEEEIGFMRTAVKNISEVFGQYAKAVEAIDNGFNLEKTFLNKIFEILESLSLKQHPNPQKQTTLVSKPASQSSSHSSMPKQPSKSSETRAAIPKNSHIQSQPGQKTRKVSIDNGISLDSNKFKANTTNQNCNFDQNEKEIYERKKKLFEMLNNPNQSHTSMHQQVQQHAQDDWRSQQASKSIQKTINNKSNVEKPHMDIGQQPQIPQTIPEHEDQLKNSRVADIKTEKQETRGQKLDKQTSKLFDNLRSQGINLPEIILHTILPREKSKQKLYEDTRQVKQRKITIPVKRFEYDEEKSSPILKKKKQRVSEDGAKEDNDNNGQIKMSKITLFAPASSQSPSTQQPQPLLLKQKQAFSIALLVQSLPLSIDKAIPLLQASLKYAHNNLSAAQYLSYLYLQLQRPKQCLQLCNRILQQLQDSSQCDQLCLHINNNKAAALNMLGRYSESIGILQRCLNHTKCDIYYKNLGDAYSGIGIYEKAVLNYENAIKMNGAMHEGYYNLAVCHYMQGHMAEAYHCVGRALELGAGNEEYDRLRTEIGKNLQV